MANAPMASIRTSGDTLEIVNQLLLPHTTEWVTITSVQDAFDAIKTMKVRPVTPTPCPRADPLPLHAQIRGAPAIASLAALSLAAHLDRALAAAPAPAWLASPALLEGEVRPLLDYLHTARPTAVNLGGALRRLARVLDGAAPDADARQTAGALVREARLVADEDVGRNRAMGAHGAEWVLQQVEKREGKRRKVNVLTVCNTGSLATSVSGLLHRDL